VTTDGRAGVQIGELVQIGVDGVARLHRIAQIAIKVG
jgi:hypothetical protein